METFNYLRESDISNVGTICKLVLWRISKTISIPTPNSIYTNVVST